MAEDSFRRFYLRADFLALVGSQIPLPLLQTALLELNPTLSQLIIDVRELPGESGAVLEWRARPSDADLVLVDNLIATFTGGATTDAPQVATNAGPVTASSATPVDVIDITSAPLDAGTYQVVMTCQMRMQAVVAGDAARAILTITPSPAAARVQREHWGEAVEHAYNLTATFQRQAGQTIRVQLQIAEVGPGAGTAEITNARVTIDKIG